MHRDNIIPHGSIPVPIDLEAMIGGQMPGSKLSPEIEMAPKHRERFSTPLYAETNPERLEDGVDVNGFLPRLNGRMVTVEGYEDDFIHGFADGFRRMMENTEEIVSLLEQAADAPIRTAIRSFRIYPKIVNAMMEPDRLRCAEALSDWLERIWDVLPEQKRKLYRELERDELLNLNYPEFYRLIGEGSLYRTGGTVAVKDWTDAPLDCAKARLKLLSEELLAQCVDMLQVNLATER
jgi:lantibiotic modifying enzyme